MANFGELVLVLGDAHIPQRASKISEGFQRMLVPNKMQHVVCTGNCQGIAEDLEGLAPNIHIVADENCDESVPETKILQVGAFRIGIIHGHQILPWKSSRAVEVWRRKLQVDILITGHSHQQCFQVFNNGRSLHLNPGSITGAYSPITEKVTPSFCLLAIQNTSLTCYIYELTESGEVEVNSTQFSKPEPESPSAANPELMASLLA